MLDIQTIIYILVITVALVVAFALFIFSVMQLMVSTESPLGDRLSLVSAEKNESKNQEKQPEILQVFNTIVSFFQPFSKKMYGDNTKYLDKIRRTIIETGQIPSDQMVFRILATQLVLGLGMGLVGCVLSFLITHQLIMTLIGLIGGILIGRFLAEFQLKGRASKRKDDIHRSIPDVLDLLVICVESGLAIDSAIRRVSEEAMPLAPELAYELSRLTGELNGGIPRAEAFNNLGSRTGVDELGSLCSMINQADKLGTSISKALRIYSDDLRVRRRQAAEELGQKATVKMIFPLVILIFPALFLVLMGPAVIKAIEQFN